MSFRYFFTLLSTSLLLFSCKNEKSFTTPLATHGLAKVTIESKGAIAPVVNVDTNSFFKSVSITFDSIYLIKGNITELQLTKENILTEVKNTPYFKEVLVDDPNGFIFSSDIHATIFNEFRKIMNYPSKTVIFQEKELSKYSLEEIKRLYNTIVIEK